MRNISPNYVPPTHVQPTVRYMASVHGRRVKDICRFELDINEFVVTNKVVGEVVVSSFDRKNYQRRGNKDIVRPFKILEVCRIIVQLWIQ